jgi:hypothetical protein
VVLKWLIFLSLLYVSGCSWIKRLTTSDSKPWFDIFNAVYGQELDIVKKEIISDHVVKENNTFLQDVFNSWVAVMKIRDGKIEDFFCTRVHYGTTHISRVVVGVGFFFCVCVCFCLFVCIKTWYDEGITIVGDLYDESNFF